MTPQEAAEQYGESFKTGEFFERIRIDAFISGAKWQSEQDNQALSSALKKIAELRSNVKHMESVIGDLTKENSQMKFGLQLIISFDDSSIYSDPGEIAQEYLP